MMIKIYFTYPKQSNRSTALSTQLIRTSIL